MPWKGDPMRPEQRDATRPTTKWAVQRMLAIAVQLGSGQRVSVNTIVDDYGVSLATAKRDVRLLCSVLPVTYDSEDPGSTRKYMRLVRGGSLLKLLRTEAS